MKSKRIITNLIVVLIFLVGLSLLLYPTVSNYINTKNQSYAIVSYDKNAAQLDKEKYEKIMADAREYNRTMGTYQNNFALDESRTALYNSLLNISDDGIMGYVDIPCINCKLPIYHGTNEAVLRVAIGHVEWSSLPVGGESTHSVISGHRGLPSAELLTHIDRLELGDTFYINVLNEKLEYRVDSINVVLPEDTSKLEIVEGQDYVTLVTCTPYGVNTHRLLVRGTRIPYEEAEVLVEEVMQEEPPKSSWEQKYLQGLLIGVFTALGLAVAIVSIIKIRRKFSSPGRYATYGGDRYER